jgi:hypothetical protein
LTAALPVLVVLRLPALLPTGTRVTFDELEELPVGVGATMRIVPLVEPLP